MLRLIAIVAGLIFAARALGPRARLSAGPGPTRSADRSEEELEQEVRAT